MSRLAKMFAFFSRPATSVTHLQSRSIENPAISPTDPAAMAELFGTAGSDAGVAISPRSSLRFSPIWQGVTMISADVACTPTFVMERMPEGGKERDTDHPSYKILRRKANFLTTANIWKQVAVTQAILWGNHYSLINRDSRGDPIELLPLDPDATVPKLKDDELIYETRIDNRRQRFAPEDVFHLKGTTIESTVGVRLIDMARNSIGKGIAAEKYGNKFFSNNAVPGGVIEHPMKLSDQARQHIRASIQAIHGGLSNAHRVALLEEGMKWSPTGVKPEDAQLVAVMEMSVRDAARWLNMPPHRLGDATRTSFNSVEQENLAYQQSTLGPWFCRLREEAWDKLLREDEKEGETHVIEEKRISLLAADAKTRYEVYSIGVQNGILSRDEVREFENMNPIPDGEGATFLVPLNMSETGQEEGDDEMDDANGTNGPGADEDDADTDRVGRDHRAVVETRRQDAKTHANGNPRLNASAASLSVRYVRENRLGSDQLNRIATQLFDDAHRRAANRLKHYADRMKGSTDIGPQLESLARHESVIASMFEPAVSVLVEAGYDADMPTPHALSTRYLRAWGKQLDGIASSTGAFDNALAEATEQFTSQCPNLLGDES